jgi:beta-glucosidase
MSTDFAAAVQRICDGADRHEEAAALVAVMTLDEKLGCLDGGTPFGPGLFDMTSRGYYAHPWPAAQVGAAEPGGRLPFVIPTDPLHLPDFDKDATTAVYDLFHGQWKLDRDGNDARFPFGDGAGFTTFAIDAADWTGAGAGLEVAVTNIGSRRGSTVAFVWAGLPMSKHERPVERLIGFVRIQADAGATATATIDLDWAMTDLRLDGAWVTEPGDYSVSVGQHAGDPEAIRLTISRGEDDTASRH